MSAIAVTPIKPNKNTGETVKSPLSKPYISVTGVTDAHDAKVLSKAMFSHMSMVKIPHMAALGVLVNETTLAGFPTDNLRCPSAKDIPNIFETALAFNQEVFTVVHYTCKEPHNLLRSVRKIMTLPGLYYNSEENGLCSAIQLNGGSEKVSVEKLAEIKAEFPGLSIIYQVPISDLRYGFDVLLKQVAQRAEYIDYALIDPSGGRGELIDRYCVSCANDLRDKTKVAVGVAGGLNSVNIKSSVEMCQEVFEDTNFSVDVERGVRCPLSSRYGDDVFDSQKAEAYFKNAVSAFAKFSKEV